MLDNQYVMSNYNKVFSLSQRHWVYITINFPGASYTYPGGINNIGQIFGSYKDSAGDHGLPLS